MLLVEIKEWIEKVAVIMDCQSIHGEHRSLNMLLEDGEMPQIYYEILKELNL